MKILHTSDLHLGHTLYSYDRLLEQKDCLRQIESIIKEQKPDAYIICGDIYHTTSPQNSAQEMLISHLLKAHSIAPDMSIIVTAGNHDSNKIEITDPLWNLVGVSIIASIKRNILEGEENEAFYQALYTRHIHTVKKNSEPIGYVIAIPHCYPGNFPVVAAGLSRQDRQKEFIKLLMQEVERLNTNNLPVIVMSHTAVRPAGEGKLQAVGQDLDIIGGIDMISEADFGEGYDYVALGHIHYPQNISDKMRYSGAPLPVSFDENFQHSVSLVTIDKHGDQPKIDAIDIVNKMPLITIPSQSPNNREQSLPWNEAEVVFRNMDKNKKCYVRLNITDDGNIPVAAKDVAARIPEECGLKAKFCLINRVRIKNDEDRGAEDRVRITTAELGRTSPIELAMLYLNDIKQGLDQDTINLLKETISEVESTQE